MSLPLKDFRLGITEAIDVWLDIEQAASGRDKAAIARGILGEWAKNKAHAHRIAQKRLAANGLQPELDGLDLDDAGVDAGSSRGGRR